MDPSPASLSRRRWLLAALGYVLLLAVSFAGLTTWLALDLERSASGPSIVSGWRGGLRVARHVTRGPAAESAARIAGEGMTIVSETVIDEGPVLAFHPQVFAFSFVAGRDGMHAGYRGRDAYLTPDDLLQKQLYDPGSTSGQRTLRRGIEIGAALEALARELGCTASELRQEGHVSRFVVRREVLQRPDPEHGPALDARPTARNLERAALSAARFLVRNLGRDGLFRYELKATTAEVQPGYNWPRHGGATLYLAEAARYFDDRKLLRAARRAAKRLRDDTTLRCGQHACVGEGEQVDVGSAALALLAYAALVQRDRSFRKPLEELSAFLRSQQRPDGEFMHLYDRRGDRPIDIQLPFYSGEAVLALARAHAVTKNPAELAAASRGLRYLTGPRWRFFGSHYYFDAEHWTCQAVEELWAKAPDPDALRFCMRWNGYNRWFQFGASPIGDYDGGFAGNPFFPPRLTPAGSRTEGAAATLVAATAAARATPGLVGADELGVLEDQVARALGFLMRHELPGGREYLLSDADAMRGAFPGSPVDLTLRIDFQQHAGSAMLRFAEFLRSRGRGRDG